ncbi:MAG: AAA family ATPase [Promethearchaeota archaeon]
MRKPVIIEKSEKNVNLRVDRLEKNRSGRSLCYLDEAIMIKLGLSTGDLVEIKGNKRTAGIAVSNPSDRGKSVIRMDELQRLNAGITIGENVSVQPAKWREAIEILLLPTKPNLDLRRQADAIKSKLIDKPLVSGDIIEVWGNFIKSDGDNPMSEVMKIFQLSGRRRATLGILKLVVENLNPTNTVVKVTRNTLVKVSKKVVSLNVSGKVISYNDIGGMRDEIEKVREVVELPYKHPDLFQKMQIRPPRGILIYGVSGVGKTLLIKALSQETDLFFLSINGPEIFSRSPGGSEGKLRDVFREAKDNAPSVIFIDRIDIIAPKHADNLESRVKAQLLTLMDGIGDRGDVIVIGETSRIDDIDESLRRPGRFDREIEIKLPTTAGRLEILKIHTRGMKLSDDVDLQIIAERTEGFTGADLEGLVKEAAILAMKEVLPHYKDTEAITSDILKGLQVNMEQFLNVLSSLKPHTT